MRTTISFIGDRGFDLSIPNTSFPAFSAEHWKDCILLEMDRIKKKRKKTGSDKVIMLIKSHRLESRV